MKLVDYGYELKENFRKCQKLHKKIEENIKNLNINNLKIINSAFQDGCVKESPYDIIFIDNPIDELPNSFKDQLSSKYGKIIIREIL